MLIDIKDKPERTLADLLLDPTVQQEIAPQMYRDHGHAIVDMKMKGGVAEYLTATDVAAVMEYAAERRKENPTGWIYDEKGKKAHRELAAIHPVIFDKYPHIKNDKKALIKWLKTEEGKPFCCVEKI